MGMPITYPASLTPTMTLGGCDETAVAPAGALTSSGTPSSGEEQTEQAGNGQSHPSRAETAWACPSSPRTETGPAE